MSAVKAEHGFLSTEKERVTKQLTSMSEEMNRRNAIQKDRISSLERQIETKTAEYQLIIANMSSQSELLSNSFKVRLF